MYVREDSCFLKSTWFLLDSLHPARPLQQGLTPGNPTGCLSRCPRPQPVARLMPTGRETAFCLTDTWEGGAPQEMLWLQANTELPSLPVLHGVWSAGPRTPHKVLPALPARGARRLALL